MRSFPEIHVIIFTIKSVPKPENQIFDFVCVLPFVGSGSVPRKHHALSKEPPEDHGKPCGVEEAHMLDCLAQAWTAWPPVQSFSVDQFVKRKAP